MRDATTVLESGVMLSIFMREEHFSKSGDEKVNKMFVLDASLDSAAVLKANTLVYLQLSSANIKQAKKGMGLKVRKLKSVAPGDPVLNGCFNGLPVGEAAHNALMDRARKQHAISRMLCKDEEKAFTIEVSAGAYATPEDNGYMLCDAHADTPLVAFCAAQLLELFDVRDKMKALKLFNITITLKTVRVFVSANENPTVLLQSATPFSVLCMQIDWNMMLHMHLVTGFETWPCAHSVNGAYSCSDQTLLLTHVLDGVVFWTNPALCVSVSSNEKKQVVFAMSLASDAATASETTTSHLISDYGSDTGGGGRTLDIFLSSLGSMSEIVGQAMGIVQAPGASSSSPGAAHVLRVCLKPENKGASAGKKRKRINLLS